MKISIIAALDSKRGIGKNNKLLFKIPEDFQRMKDLVSGHPVIMGRQTYESIGKILSYPSMTVILTRNPAYTVEGALVGHSLEDAVSIASKKEKNEIFLFGGEQIFRLALPFADKLYLTLVEGEFGADTFFPEYSKFKKVTYEKSGEYEGLKYKFLELER